MTIGEFILKVYRHNQKLKRDGVVNEIDTNIHESEKKIESYMDMVDDVKKEKDHDYIANLISDYFSHKLF